MTRAESAADGQTNKRAAVDGSSSAESSSCSSSEPSPRQRRCGSRPQPEGARSVSITETDRDDVTKATELCKQCQVTVAELKRQALALTEPTSLQDPGFATFLFDQLQLPDWPVQGGHEGARCPVCATSMQQLRQQALQALQDLCPGTELPAVSALPSKTFPGQPTRVTTHGVLTLSSRPPASRIPHSAHSIVPVAEQRRGLGLASSTKPSVQVTMGGGALSGALSSVTIQAQQYLEGMWSISRVNNFLAQPSPTHGPVTEPDQPAPLSDMAATSVSISPSRHRSPVRLGPAVTLSSSQPTSTATSFFIRAAQKLNLSSKRKKTQPSMLQPPEPSIYPTNFSSILQLSPPPAPPCLLRASSKAKENPGMGKLSDLGRANLYLSLLRELIRTYIKDPGYASNLQQNYVSRLTINCVRLLSEPSEQNPSIAGQMQKAVSMATLALLCELADQCLFNSQSEAMRSLCSLTAYFYPPSSSLSTPQFFNQTLLKPSSTADIPSRPSDDPLLKDWSRVVAYFIRDQWTCLSFIQKFAETSRATTAFQSAVEALSLLPSDLVIPVLDFMCAAIPQVLHEDALCVEAVSVSWTLVHAMSTNAHDFWPALQAFVRLAFHRSVLELHDGESHKITARIQQVTCELIELSQAKLGVFNTLIKHCCNTWLPSGPNNHNDTVFQSALNHLDILIEACIYGPVFRRDQRLLQEVQSYVEQLREALAENVVINSWNRDVHFPRVCVLAFLSHLEPSSILHQELMENLVKCLLKKDKDISKSKVRYYANCTQHRVKNRVWQTLLLLLPKLRPEFVVEYVFGMVCEAGFGNNQPSVKYLIEWALILILHQNPSHIQHLWVCFNMDQEKTKTSICTFLSVLVHLGILLPKLKDKARQWKKAIEVILLWCFSHNFTVRLYALLALKRVWGLEEARLLAENEQCSSASLQGLATVVEACLHQAEVMQNTGNALKNWSRIQEHFFFSTFHPLNDYSVETIFHTFPVLSELAEDECIPVWKFEKLVDFQHSSSLPLKNVGRELRELQPSDWVQQDKGELKQEECWADVQKKIAPWSLNVQEEEPQIGAQQRVTRLGKVTTALLVVASLIDKPTNLGGLCRTCEIFGASALVLGSLHHVGDKQFQALSVSSELWLPLMEVKPMDLAGFLQLKQREGYSIIGVEQTVNSQSLQSYKFPEKTLLLLGNEREGIPADLLQLLDVCVEIPQQGVTRSLNVHVSAALLVWEYTRQHLGPDQSS